MPIRPENRARYPKNWKCEIVPAVRARSGDKCECTGQCGINHGLVEEARGVRCPLRNGQIIIGSTRGVDIRVVLTVMHLNHQPEDNRMENLLHGCQGCHNRYDAPMRAAGIRERRRAAQADGDLFQPDGEHHD